MPSIIPNYEYDIFISYRQNDNKRDKWVTEFVSALQDELDATLKNAVSIYFDENPHDGLLETHDVDRSLEKKLKCLIFIPIISQTYCDPNCFAWEHELLPFIEFANKDELGMNITLVNGNVASRILPIRIHDIDSNDISLYEQTIGGHLRPIDFVYKEPGVNRPLSTSDDRNLNQEGTDYKNQINKVANALKEIGEALLRKEQVEVTTVQEEKPVQLPKEKTSEPSYLRYGLVALLLVFVLGGLSYWWLQPTLAHAAKIIAADKSLAILPFKNLSGHEEHDFLSYALKDEVYQSLALGKYFAFMSSLQATFPYAKSDKKITEIGDELKVDYILSGFYQVLGDQLKITVELADAETGFSLWTFPTTLNYQENNVATIQKQISDQVMSYFESEYDKTKSDELLNNDLNFESYKHFMKGQEWENKGFADENVLGSIHSYEKALELDSMHLEAWQRLIKARCFYIWGNKRDDSKSVEIQQHIDLIKKEIIYLEKYFPQWVDDLANGIYEYHVLGNFETGLNYLKKVHAKYPNNKYANSLLSAIYKRKLMAQKSAEHMSKVIQLDPLNSRNWIDLSLPYIINGNYEKAIECITNALELGIDSTFYNGLLIAYMDAGYTLKELPQAIRQSTDNQIMRRITWGYSTPQELLKHIDTLEIVDGDGIDKYSRIDYLVNKTSLCYAIEEDDSVKYYANEILEESKDRGEPLLNVDAYAYLGFPSKAIDIQEKERFSSDDNEDLSLAARKSYHIIRLYVLAKQYQKATELLIQMNKDYPELGDYAEFKRWWYDRAKKEYPPFKEALDNLKLPPPLITGIKLDRSKR